MAERELILAIIQQAVIDSKVDVTKFKTKEKRLEAQIEKEKAEIWIKSNSQAKMTFSWYCGLLDIDPDWARRKIKQNGHIGKSVKKEE